MKKQKVFIEFKKDGKKTEAICHIDDVGRTLYGVKGLMKNPKNSNFKVRIV